MRKLRPERLHDLPKATGLSEWSQVSPVTPSCGLCPLHPGLSVHVLVRSLGPRPAPQLLPQPCISPALSRVWLWGSVMVPLSLSYPCLPSEPLSGSASQGWDRPLLPWAWLFVLPVVDPARFQDGRSQDVSFCPDTSRASPHFRACDKATWEENRQQ